MPPSRKKFTLEVLDKHLVPNESPKFSIVHRRIDQGLKERNMILQNWRTSGPASRTKETSSRDDPAEALSRFCQSFELISADPSTTGLVTHVHPVERLRTATWGSGSPRRWGRAGARDRASRGAPRLRVGGGVSLGERCRSAPQLASESRYPRTGRRLVFETRPRVTHEA